MTARSLDSLNAEVSRLEKDLREKRIAEAQRRIAELNREIEEAEQPVEVDVETAVENDVETAVENDVETETGPDEPTESASCDESGSGRSPGALARFVPKRRRTLVAAVVAAVLVAGSVCTVLLWPSSGLPNGVAFSVGGHNVTADELNAEIQTLGALYGIQAPTDKTKLDAFERTSAKAYAVSLIIDKAAESRNIVIADKKAQDVLSRYIAQQFGNSADATSQFVTALGQVGTNQDAVLTEIKRQLALEALLDSVTADVKVTAADVADYFAKNRASLATPQRRSIHNIVVSTESAAAQLKRQLDQGGSFTALAKQYSLDASTRASGGDLGTVAAADLEPAYAKQAFAAKTGATFGPVQTQYGWNVGQVTAVVPPAPAVFDRIKTELEQQLLVQAKLASWRAWLERQIRAAHVRYAADYRPADPNAAPTSQFGPTGGGASGGSGR